MTEALRRRKRQRRERTAAQDRKRGKVKTASQRQGYGTKVQVCRTHHARDEGDEVWEAADDGLAAGGGSRQQSA